jgi:NADPH-dependent curcumin reductase CurA
MKVESIPLEFNDGEVIDESSMLSVDAFIRTMLDAEAYHGSVDLGATLPAIGYGRVIASGRGGPKVGTVVAGMLGAQKYATVKSTDVSKAMKFPFMSQAETLGLMGLTTGLTAYTGVFYVSRRPRKGETVVVTGAAGAVGSVAAQLAKSTGARVIGVAGGAKKCAYLLKELKLDGAIDYKDEKRTLVQQLDDTCPDGVDFFFDNVGGVALDVVLDKINPGGRIVICGAASQYNGKLNKGLVEGPSNYLKLAERGAEMKGFNVMQHFSKLPFALFGMFWLHLRGKVTLTQHIEKGIRAFPFALQKIFTGGHIGKMLVNVN